MGESEICSSVCFPSPMRKMVCKPSAVQLVGQPTVAKAGSIGVVSVALHKVAVHVTCWLSSQPVFALSAWAEQTECFLG